MPTEITINGYLVQAKLEEALKALVGHAWIGRELQVPESRRRWDMAYRIQNTTVVVEFDGDEHYRNTLKIKVDREKDRVAEGLGYRVVRIPYWVQITTETLQHFFGLVGVVNQDFPHGFIATKVFPASFCELGLIRFSSELELLPVSVRQAVMESLRARVNEHGIEYVIPSSLRHQL